MKIVYTIAGLYRPAGMERILTDKANYLARKGHEVLIVTTEQEGRPDAFPLLAGVRRADLGIGYEKTNGKSFLDKALRYPFKKITHSQRLAELLIREHPDVTVSLFCGDESFLPDIMDGSKKVLEVHFSRFKRLQYGRKGLWALADRWLSHRDERHIRRFDKFVTLTDEDLGYWGRPENGVCIPNFINVMPAVTASTEAPHVLAIGRFCHQKAFDRLLRAWKQVKQDSASRGWTLRLAGGGEDADKLRALAAELNLTDSVEILGARRDVESLYREASVYALSSRYEGLPMVLLEAQSYGLPIVSFDCQCGPRDVVTDGKDGFLVPEGDIDGLAARLCELIRNPELRREMGLNARLAAARWDKEKIMQQWIRLFKSA